MYSAERTDKLLNDLTDYSVEGSFGSGFGPSGFEPAVDFPVCRRAVEELVAMGDVIIPRMLEVLASDDSVQAYFVVEVVARLRAVEAVDALEKLFKSRAFYSRRVNYDQFIDYAVYERAFEALLQFGKARAIGVLRPFAEEHERGRWWAEARLAELTRADESDAPRRAEPA